MSNITIGTDPEFLVFHNGVPFSSYRIIGGSKKHPIDIGEGCGLQEDNVTVELTTPPCKTLEEFLYYINYGKRKIKEIIKQNTGLDVDVVSKSSAFYPEEQLIYPEVRQFGCEPSFCIYTGDVSPRPSAEEIGNLRSAGFHVHIGYPKLLTVSQQKAIIFAMDIMLGVGSIIIDDDIQRRMLYGNAGDFRRKLFDEEQLTIIEYRTLGAALHESDKTISWVYNQTIKAVELFEKGKTMNGILKYLNLDTSIEEIRSIIDEGKEEEASELMSQLKIKNPYELVLR